MCVFPIKWGRGILAPRIYTNNLHHVEHIFSVKFQKEASTREMEIRVRTISHKNIFGRKNSSCAAHDELSPHEQLINGTPG